MIAAILAAPYPGFEAPDPAHEFSPEPIWSFNLFGLDFAINRLTVLSWFASLLLLVFLVAASRKPKIVPGKLQFAGEGFYGFIRNGIARDVIGPNGIKYAPFLATFFVFILFHNLMGIFPLAMIPPTGSYGLPLILALIVLLFYIGVGIKNQGLGTYLKNLAIVPGVPPAMHVILIPLEILQKLIIRPFTLSVRLLANMFAGHLLLTVFILGGVYMLSQPAMLLKILSPAAFLMALAMTFFELMIQTLQAYVFTLLAATYIEESASGGH
ncbi:F0F1 ATP synthase subunit A [Blastococcus sp. Marseille-P5729]|uniref:F0F1 ATP synthase subunit A n=1 Tax=Blastococcus sp. Marseille-P5729 TaxID=2086582 RepID=UPI000D0EB6FF|nr:F0F1 ATP synthase subunit A [Blastococcus sp. Marseille-P5729]